MRLKTLLIVSLLAIVIAAPVVDAVACDDCNDAAPACAQVHASGMDHAEGDLLSPDAGHSAQREAGTARDLCPVCANMAIGIDTACCCAPSLISQTTQLPRLIAASDPSYPIIKPPQI